MKSTFYKSFLLLLLTITFGSCVTDEVVAPKLVCTQPDLVTNKTVHEVHAVANAIVTQYKYDDIIEAYVVSSDESGNFFKSISL